MIDYTEKLIAAARAIYLAAYWTADRPVDEIGLWTELRDALDLEPGISTKVLGLKNTSDSQR